MFDEKEARQLCIRAAEQYIKASPDISASERDDGLRIIDMLKAGTLPDKNLAITVCGALSFYLKSLKAIEVFMISNPLFKGFDGTNPLLVALDKEIGSTLQTKAKICHEDIPVRLESRVDW